jgi:hypothetical protein
MKLAGRRSVGDECSVQRNGFAVEICEEDLLGAGRERGSYDEKSVVIFERNSGGLSVDGDEATAANRESGTSGCGNGGRRDGADSQGNSESGPADALP